MERELLLLGVLRHGEMHGYQLHDFIEKNMAFCTDLKKPTAYFLLDKMQDNGWVAVKEAREGNRPQKRIYRLTAKGEAAFQELLRDNLSHFSSARTGSDVGLAVLLKIFQELDGLGISVLVQEHEPVGVVDPPIAWRRLFQ